MDEQFAAFWQSARMIRLTNDESAAIKAQITISTENRVRAKATAGQNTRMNRGDILTAQHIQLSREENEEIRSNVLDFMRTHPVHVPVLDEEAGFFSSMFPFRFMPTFSALAGLILLLGGTVSVTAQSALPGDFLYPVKVHVNESVEAALHISADGRAQFEAQRLENRLEEAARLAAAGRLSGDAKEEITQSIESQLTLIQQAAEGLAANGNADAALDIHSQVESNLIANAAILGSLAKEASETAKEDVRDLLKNVASAERKAVQSRVATEKAVAGVAKTNAQATAEVSVQAATKKIDETRVFMDKVESAVDAGVFAQADARFDHSKRILTTARALLDGKKFDEAFRNAKEAQRTAQEAKTMVKVAAGLKMQTTAAAAVSTTSQEAPTVRAKEKEKEATTSVQGGVQTDTNVDIKTPDVQIQQNNGGGVKVDVGF